MARRDLVAEEFERERPQLRAVAYRMLGSISEAEDAVQEAWLRLARSDAGAIDNLGAWLTTVVARVSLDMLRSRRARREEYVGDRLPDPIVADADGSDPEREALLADSVGLALLVVLDTLGPDERLAFVLHDTFARPLRADRADHRPLAGRRPPAGRRARRRVRGARLARPATVNGAAGLVVARGGRAVAVIGFTTRGGRIVEIDVVADRDRLRDVPVAP